MTLALVVMGALALFQWGCLFSHTTQSPLPATLRRVGFSTGVGRDVVTNIRIPVHFFLHDAFFSVRVRHRKQYTLFICCK